MVSDAGKTGISPARATPGSADAEAVD
jgi:hypothetical protein